MAAKRKDFTKIANSGNLERRRLSFSCERSELEKLARA
jgi:hypothetical protein